MRTFTLLLALVAGVAGAQPGPTNCRSSATDCSAHVFKANAAAGEYVLSNGTSGWGIWTNSSNGQMNFALAGGATILTLTSTTITGALGTPFSSPAAAGTNGFQLTQSGAWLDLGAGAGDRLKSDSSNIISDTHFIPSTDAVLTLGASASNWLRGYYTRGVVLGSTSAWSAAPLSNNTQEASQLLYNSSSGNPTYRNGSRAYNELGGGKDWVIEKRELLVDVGFENTNCPVAAQGLRGTGAAAVTIACTDAAAASQSTADAESFRVLNTTAAAASVSLVDLSGNVTKRELGPKLKQKILVPSGSDTNVRMWVALVPTATSLTGVDTGAISVIGFRYSTVAGDTAWQACRGNGAAVTCSSTSQVPDVGRSMTLEVDCREVTACRFLINGSLVVSETTVGNLPASTTQMAPRLLVQATSAAVRSLGYGRAALETN